MSDNYQAVYDAVRSRMGGCDVGAAVREALDLQLQGVSYAVDAIKQSYCIAADEQTRPCVLFKPRLSIDGNQWCALYGDNLQDGVAGFGNSPSDAMDDFDRNWLTKLQGAAA